MDSKHDWMGCSALKVNVQVGLDLDLNLNLNLIRSLLL